MKTCNKCGEVKPLEQFDKRHDRPSRHNYCKACASISARERAARKGEAGLEARRKKYWENHEARLAEHRNRYRTNAEQENNRAKARYRTDPKWRTRVVLQGAVRAGRILKPANCESCGNPTASRQLHAHHGDYSKPLDVQWLCTRCHGATHRQIRNGGTAYEAQA